MSNISWQLCVSLPLGSLLCSMGLYVCFYASAILSCLVRLCSIVWNQKICCLQHYSFSRLLWLWGFFLWLCTNFRIFLFLWKKKCHPSQSGGGPGASSTLPLCSGILAVVSHLWMVATWSSCEGSESGRTCVTISMTSLIVNYVIIWKIRINYPVVTETSTT